MTKESFNVTCGNQAETDSLGLSLSRVAESGLVVALTGDLGAGKTHFVRACALGLGVLPQMVGSPTFALMHSYEGRLPVYHFDTYRLRSVDEFLELGCEDYLYSNGVCFVEWAERMTAVLPPDRVNISIRILGETVRDFLFQATGSKSSMFLDRLKNELSRDVRMKPSFQSARLGEA